MQDIASPRIHTAANLPAQAISEDALIEKCAKGDERSTEAVNRRVARALAQAAAYGSCCLGSINLTRFVLNAFAETARFDEAAFAEVATVATRMLDNVLDVTVWPLAQQQDEERNKRRVGLGFTGLGDALIMLNLRYDTAEARSMARHISDVMRDAAYDASIELARERGAFPLFNADLYRSGSNFASRLPQLLKDRIRLHGLRNSHLLSIAPTGTISLAFADNARNGIEPAFSWSYTRKKRMANGSFKEYAVEDHAWRTRARWMA